MKSPDVHDTTRDPVLRKDMRIHTGDPLGFFRGLFNSLFLMAAFVAGGLLVAELVRRWL